MTNPKQMLPLHIFVLLSDHLENASAITSNLLYSVLIICGFSAKRKNGGRDGYCAAWQAKDGNIQNDAPAFVFIGHYRFYTLINNSNTGYHNINSAISRGIHTRYDFFCRRGSFMAKKAA